MVNSKVVQAAGHHPDQVGKIVLGVPQYIFDNPQALNARQGMFDSDANV